MKVIEGEASRSWSVKVPKLDFRGEERYRPHEELTVRNALKASIDADDDPVECQKQLNRICEAVVDAEVEAERRKRAELVKAEIEAEALRVAAEERRRLAEEEKYAPPKGFTKETWKAFRQAVEKYDELTGQGLSVPQPQTEKQAIEMTQNLKLRIDDALKGHAA